MIAHLTVSEIFPLEIRGLAIAIFYACGTFAGARNSGGSYKKSGSRWKPNLQTGYPFEHIIDVANRLEVDLIVMGSHSHAGLLHLLLGSTAERVVQHARCPVLVVKERHEQSTAGGAVTG